MRNILYALLTVSFFYIIAVTGNGCAQIGSIPGGPKDSLPPRLITSSPKQPAINIKDGRISLTFDEYVELQELQNNLIISPYPKKAPEISSRLKTVSVKLKDSLLPNTTYSIQFGSSIRDVNENNPAKGFTYVFSTGSHIDSLTLSGKLVMAETGKPDSTLLILLYRDAVDSTVEKQKPNYISFINGDGSFEFKNLPAGKFSVYALKDGDGGKTYNSKTEIFGFLDSAVTVSEKTAPVTLYAYAEEKKDKAKPAAPAKNAVKKLRYAAGITGAQDIRKNLEITFSNKLKLLDSTKLLLTDTNYKPLPVSFSIDSNLLVIKTKWAEDFDYRLIIQKDAVRDITDSSLSKTDTLRFKTKSAADYGNVTLRFNKIDSAAHLVLQFIQNDQVAETFPLTGKEWKYKLFPPGEYEIRILYDVNNNGQWDPGSYSKKKQPEKVVALPKKFAVKENWDNESDINL
ncbi:MAG: Ig-like domain-containing protein [Ferruginibacter sp.]